MSHLNIAFDRYASIGTVMQLHFGNKHTVLSTKIKYNFQNRIVAENLVYLPVPSPMPQANLPACFLFYSFNAELQPGKL